MKKDEETRLLMSNFIFIPLQLFKMGAWVIKICIPHLSTKIRHISLDTHCS